MGTRGRSGVRVALRLVLGIRRVFASAWKSCLSISRATIAGGMAYAGSFKVPTMVAQDLAIIMEFVDPPQPQVSVHNSEGLTKFASRGARNGVAKADVEEDDIGSSGTESEDEVEAEIVSGPSLDENGAMKSLV